MKKKESSTHRIEQKLEQDVRQKMEKEMSASSVDRVHSWIDRGMRLREYYARTNIGAYAAQAGYFFMLSFIPIIVLLLTLLRYTSIPMEDAVREVLQVFPSSVEGLVSSVIKEVYEHSSGMIPLTIIVAVWSAGKGVLAVNYGLNSIYDHIETRNYIYLRIRASIYTLFFVVAIVLSLVLSVFGNSIAEGINPSLAVLRRIVDMILSLRYPGSLLLLTVLWVLVYRFLPNRKDMGRSRWYEQLPGACLSTAGWMLISYVFSIYLDIFRGFRSLYGSMTTLMLVMLWLYICMYTILLGGLLNAVLEKRRRA